MTIRFLTAAFRQRMIPMNLQRSSKKFASILTVILVGSLPAFAIAATVNNTDWPGFRGVMGDGIAQATSVFSPSGNVGLKIGWKVSIGSGYSGVAIAEGVAVTMFSDGKSDVMAAFDIKTGAERWRFAFEDTYVGHDGAHTGPISTPVIGNGHAYGLGALGRLFAINLKSGSLVWSVDLVKDHEATMPFYGFSTSPMLRDDVLIVSGGVKAAAVAGFEAKTGKLLWNAGEDTIDYQSPIEYKRNGQAYFVAAGKKKISAVSGKNGELVWDFEHDGKSAQGAASISPVPVGQGRLFIANKDQTSAVFSLNDSDKTFEAKVAWETKAIRKSYNVPVYYDGYLYAFSSRFLTCVDANTGEAAWRTRETGDGFLILVDGHLVIGTKKTGQVHIVRASPSGFESRAQLPVFDDLIWTNPSYADGSIFVRSLGELARVDILKVSAPAAPQLVDASKGVGKFSSFLKEVASATNKKAIVDEFMSSISEFPLIEGDKTVHFIYRGQGSDIAIGSDIFGARQEGSMTRVAGTDLFYRSVTLEADARVNYMFIRDYEDHIVDPNNPRKTTSQVYGKEMAMNFGGPETDMSWLSMPKWQAPTFLSTPDKAKLGKLDSREMDSKVLEGKLAIDVYLPAGYDGGSRRYPVVYVQGGEKAITRGDMPQALNNLIGTCVKPINAVFIKLEGRHKVEKISEMLASEIIPYIDENFRTVASRDARASVGTGFDGYNAIFCGFANNELIGKVGAESAFMFTSMKTPLMLLIKTANQQPMDIFLEWGKYDLRNPDEAWNLVETNRDFVKTLREKGYKPSGGEIPDGTGWSSWRNRSEAMFGAIFPNQ